MEGTTLDGHSGTAGDHDPRSHPQTTKNHRPKSFNAFTSSWYIPSSYLSSMERSREWEGEGMYRWWNSSRWEFWLTVVAGRQRARKRWGIIKTWWTWLLAVPLWPPRAVPEINNGYPLRWWPHSVFHEDAPAGRQEKAAPTAHAGVACQAVKFFVLLIFVIISSFSSIAAFLPPSLTKILIPKSFGTIACSWHIPSLGSETLRREDQNKLNKSNSVIK